MNDYTVNYNTHFLEIARQWFHQQGWEAFPFQEQVWEEMLNGNSGLLNAPTGCGKTYALWMPCLLEFIRQNPNDYTYKENNGLRVLWITPLKALAKDIQQAMDKLCHDLDIPWNVAIRSGDTPSSQRQKQKKNQPECLITTPESLHLLLAQKDARKFFTNLQTVVVDEWHELLGSKRGVQIELALSRLRAMHIIDGTVQLKTWAISATIGNLEQAKTTLLGRQLSQNSATIRANMDKKLEITSILPETIEKFPWAGHMGLNMAERLLPIIDESRTTLLFTNTRAMAEIWYHLLLQKAPYLAGQMAMHHGSLDQEVRSWVEQSLHEGKLKLVVCTSSLDLGVDFRPVETVIQIGSPKGIARFAQRAGRSGHYPGAVSKAYFMPTHSLELVEAAAIKSAIHNEDYEARKPLEKSYDVLVQYLVTLAVGDGFEPEQTRREIEDTHAFRNMTDEEWQWCLQFITTGGKSLGRYSEFSKVEWVRGAYRVMDRKTAMRHRLSIGTIVSDPALRVKYMTGGNLGTIEESFVSRLKQGDVFWFAGKALKFERMKDMEVLVRRSNRKKGVVPRWNGARMPLSTQLSEMVKWKLERFQQGATDDVEVETIAPLLDLQNQWSTIPNRSILLLEYFTSKEGYHLYIYPFAGRAVHELMAPLMAWRIGQMASLSFSMAMNDYGFELLSDQPIPVEEALELDLFRMENLYEDLHQSINDTEMAKRRFREIATISGLVFQGNPQKSLSFKHLQASSGIIYDVFSEYDPENLLMQQAMQEALAMEIEQSHLGQVMQKINQLEIMLKYPPRITPFAFPIMVDRLRESFSSESLEDRIAKMQVQLENYAEQASGSSKPSP